MPAVIWLCHIWILLLVVLWFVCAVKIPAKERKGLLPMGCAVFLLAAVLFGGNWLLGQAGLTWRIVPRLVLSLLLWWFGLAAGMLTVRDVGKVFRGKRGFAGAVIKTVAVLLLAVSMGFGTLFGGAWVCSNPAETVGIYRGEKVVQGSYNWLNVYYELYEYRGPLVRGKQRISASYESYLRSET